MELMEETLTRLESHKTQEVMILMERVNKWYQDFHVLKDIDLTVMAGERIVICGPSGSGKSTLIRCINRLEAHQRGRIVVDGIELTEDVKAIDAIRREVGMVFQHFNLFPHLTVLENCTLAPIWVKKMPHLKTKEPISSKTEKFWLLRKKMASKSITNCRKAVWHNWMPIKSRLKEKWLLSTFLQK